MEEIERACSANDTKKIKMLARRYNQKYYGVLNLPVLKAINVNKSVCRRLIAARPPSVDYISFNEQTNRWLALLNASAPTPSSTALPALIGTIQASILGLLYLQRSHPRAFTPLVPIDTVLATLFEQRFNILEDIDDFQWDAIGYVWDGKRLTGPMTKPSQTRRFGIAILTLKSSKYLYHANLLIYDNLRRHLERIEPFEVDDKQWERKLHYKELHKALRSQVFPEALTFQPPIDHKYFKRVGLQRLQQNEKNVTRAERRYCQPWTFLYVDMRLSYPNTDSAHIVPMLKQAAGTDDRALTTFIQRYSDVLLQYGLVIQHNSSNIEHTEFIDPRVHFVYQALLLLQNATVTPDEAS